MPKKRKAGLTITASPDEFALIIRGVRILGHELMVERDWDALKVQEALEARLEAMEQQEKGTGHDR